MSQRPAQPRSASDAAPRSRGAPTVPAAAKPAARSTSGSARRELAPGPDLAQALGHAASDKRLDILRRLGEAGSISQAARGAGVSYKAAWQAIETLGNLAGTPVVEKVVGGSGGGGARLTEAGRQVLVGAERQAAARRALLAELQGRDPAWRAPGLGALALRTSLRNQLPATVRALTRAGGMVRVQLDLGDGQLLAARITRESAQLLALAPGLPVLALCKATGVQVAANLPERAGSNRLAGRVTRASGAAGGGEVSLRLASGQQLVGFAPAGHGLRAGRDAVAWVEESGVVVALTQ